MPKKVKKKKKSGSGKVKQVQSSSVLIRDGHMWSFLFVFVFVGLTIAYLNRFDFASNSGLHDAAVQNTFSDVNEDDPSLNAILFVKQNGIMNGFADGTFKPTDKVTRAEFLKMVVTDLHLEPHGLSNSFCFKDVKDEWFAPFVCYAKNHGWVSGLKDGTFHPGDYVTFDQTEAVLDKAFKADLSKIVYAAAGTNSQVTRADLAEIFYKIGNK